MRFRRKRHHVMHVPEQVMRQREASCMKPEEYIGLEREALQLLQQIKQQPAMYDASNTAPTASLEVVQRLLDEGHTHVVFRLLSKVSMYACVSGWCEPALLAAAAIAVVHDMWQREHQHLQCPPLNAYTAS